MKRLLVIALLLLLAACKEETPPRKPAEPASRTFLLYLAMENNLDIFATDNIDGLVAGVQRDGLNGGRILVYLDTRAAAPQLMEIDEQGEVDVLKNYKEQDSADPAVLRAVLDDAKRLAPARGYALDIGSHATGWLPASYDIGTYAKKLDGVPLTRTVADEGNGRSRMELDELDDVLLDGELEYLIFDACFMGGVESAFALRNKAKRIVASPAEILARGMPYDEIVGDLMAATPRLDAVARKYYEFYDAPAAPADWESSWIRSATIALYDCSKLEALARAMLPIFAREQAAIAAMNTAEIQHFTSKDQPRPFTFDMADFVSALIPDTTDPLRTQFAAALAAAVPYKAATPAIMGNTPITTYCGMGLYIPTEANANVALNAAWRQTEWAEALLSTAN